METEQSSVNPTSGWKCILNRPLLSCANSEVSQPTFLSRAARASNGNEAYWPKSRKLSGSLSKELLQVIGHFRGLLSSERCQTGQMAQSGKYLPYKYEGLSSTPNTQVKHWVWWNVPGEADSGHWSVGLANQWAPDELQVKVRGQSRGRPPAPACIFTCTHKHVHVHTQSKGTVLTCHLISSTLGVLTAACEPQPDREREGDLDVLGFSTEIQKTPFSRLKRWPSS